VAERTHHLLQIGSTRLLAICILQSAAAFRDRVQYQCLQPPQVDIVIIAQAVACSTEVE